MSSQKMPQKCKLTKRIVEGLEPDPTKRIVLWDTEVIGFCVRVYPTGRKTYFLQYRNKRHETHKIKIGVHGSITTEVAREKARQLALSISLGEDPSVKLAPKEMRTIYDLGEEYLKSHAKIRKKEKGCKEDEFFLREIIYKKFGDMDVISISSFDLQKLHAELKQTPYKANRVRALLSKMFNLAVSWGWRTDNPIRGVEKYQEYKRHRWLNNEELERLWAVLDGYHTQSIANAFRLLLLTGSRRNEVLRATWDQFDLEKEIWTKPAHTTKQKRMEHLPLSQQAVELLKTMKVESTSSLLFPGRVPGKPLQEIKKSWETITKKAGLSDIRIHDLRHTHASHLVSSGLSLSIVGKLLGHTQASTTQRYAHLADEPLRQATQVFGDKIGTFKPKKYEEVNAQS